MSVEAARSANGPVDRKPSQRTTRDPSLADGARAIEEAWRLPAALCPYLATESGEWRAAFPSREHRCTAVAPPVALALDKQRRLCLTPDHETCPTYLAANLARAAALPAETAAGQRPGLRRRAPQRRPLARTTPILLERPRPGLPLPQSASRIGGQVLLVGLLVVAFAAIAVARFGVAGSPQSSTPPPSAVASPSPTASPTPLPTPISPSPSARPSPSPRATPRASAVTYRTYRVRKATR